MLCTYNFHFVHFVLFTTWNDLFAVVWTTGAYEDKFSILSRYLQTTQWFQFNSRVFRIHFASIMNWEIIVRTPIYIFRWRSLPSHCRLILSFLLITKDKDLYPKIDLLCRTQKVKGLSCTCVTSKTAYVMLPRWAKNRVFTLPGILVVIFRFSAQTSS